jgi:CBS domain-containing protein
MEGITLFIFGGVAEMRDEPPSPKAEFWMAVAGPAASLAVAGACFAAALVGGALGAPEPVSTVVGYLATINVILAVFNMMPAFPLDGGRVLRSVLWGWKENIRWATRISSNIGIAFGALLIAVGLFSLLNGRLVGGLWWILIGLFIRQGAQGSYRQLLMRREFEGEPVRRFMSRDPITVGSDTSIEALVENHVYRHHHKLYPVVDDGRLVGCVTTREIKQIPREEWRQRTVGSAARPCSADNTVAADDDAMKALSIMKRSKASRLMVVDGDRLIGVLGLKDLLDFFSLKMELEDEG